MAVWHETGSKAATELKVREYFGEKVSIHPSGRNWTFKSYVLLLANHLNQLSLS